MIFGVSRQLSFLAHSNTRLQTSVRLLEFQIICIQLLVHLLERTILVAHRNDGRNTRLQTSVLLFELQVLPTQLLALLLNMFILDAGFLGYTTGDSFLCRRRPLRRFPH